MSDCPECGVINYGLNPRCASCVRKVMGERIKVLDDGIEAAMAIINADKARIALLEKEVSELKSTVEDYETEITELFDMVTYNRRDK
jgi:hypothetical protein